MPNYLAIDPRRFNNEQQIELRILEVPEVNRGFLRTALKYLYNDDGPINLPRERLLASRKYLDEAELLIIGWLYTRTNGKLRKSYGAAALRAARENKYRCQECGFADVRTLNLDHVGGKVAGAEFACLCANCHAIKSRKFDWTGKSPNPTENPEIVDSEFPE